MTDSINCSLMSHASCQAIDVTGAAETRPEPAFTEHGENDQVFSSYDCVNDCVSSMGVVALVDGALSALGCVALPPACPVLIGTTVGVILGACDGVCRELEHP
jgi:hypothetical protein